MTLQGHNVKNTLFITFVLGVYVLIFFRKRFFVYARPLQVQTKAHFNFLQFLAMTYDMGFYKLCFRRYLILGWFKSFFSNF